jgi:PAS domain S-box-containing protein
MDLRTYSNQELAQTLRELQRPSETVEQRADRLEDLVQELQVHRIELEMQNRALQETQAELELAVRRFADLYDHLPLGYLTVSAEGKIEQANLAAADLLGRERPALAGVFVRSFLDAYDAGRFAAHLENCLESGQQSTLELKLRLRDGTTRGVQFTSRRAPVPPGMPAHVHIGISDISQLKQVQRTLEEINQEQEAFNYSISHDLRSPLVTINNYARIVLTDHAQQLDDEARGMLRRIQSAASRMEDTLRHLLHYSSLSREEITLSPVNVDDVVRELLLEHSAMILERQGDVLVDRPLPTVRACRVVLSQVLANLLTNALKYTRPGEAPSVRIFAEETENTVVLKVADQGIGIDPAHHERIFRVFERLHGRYPGTGVGLAIARRAVERMGGRIWVNSELGCGSCFSVELPRA